MVYNHCGQRCGRPHVVTAEAGDRAAGPENDAVSGRLTCWPAGSPIPESIRLRATGTLRLRADSGARIGPPQPTPVRDFAIAAKRNTALWRTPVAISGRTRSRPGRHPVTMATALTPLRWVPVGHRHLLPTLRTATAHHSPFVLARAGDIDPWLVTNIYDNAMRRADHRHRTGFRHRTASKNDP